MVARATAAEAALLFGLAAIGAVLFFGYNGFPLGLVPDELVKISNIRGETINFNHPWLMIQTIRLACAGLAIDAPQAIAVVGRSVTALAALGGLLVFYVILRGVFSRAPAAIAVLLCMLSPLVIVQAHHIKEDTWLLASLVALLAVAGPVLDAPSWRRGVWLGVALALVVSSKAVGLFVLPVLLLTAATAPSEQRRPALRALLVALPIAMLGVLVLNLPIVWGGAAALQNVRAEISHSVEGHWDGIRYPTLWYLRFDAWRAFRWLLVPAGFGLAALAMGRRPLATLDRFFLFYGLVYYSLIEIAPLVTWPQTERYLHPLILPLGYFAAHGLECVAHWAAAMPRRAIVAAVIGLGIGAEAARQAHTAFRAYRSDTRVIADDILRPYGARALLGAYTSASLHSSPAVPELPVASTVGLVVVSSFIYDRFAVAAARGGQRLEVYRANAVFDVLFRLPYCEIRATQEAVGFANPTIRVVAVPHAGETMDAARARLPVDPRCIAAPALRAE